MDNLEYKELIDQLNIGVIRIRIKDLAIVFANRKAQQILGLAEEQLQGKALSDLVEDEKQIRELLERLNKDGKDPMPEFPLLIQGRTMTCSRGFLAESDGKSSTEFINLILNEMADYQQAQRELKESRELFRSVFDNSAVAILVTDAEERIVAWNPYTERLLGMDKTDLFNKHSGELYPPSEWERITSLAASTQSLDIETQICRKGGNPLDIHMSVSFVKDADGKKLSTIKILRDITKQKLAERRIKESENKIRIILDNSAASIMLTDENERIVSWNKYTEQMLGYAKNELYLRPVSSLYPPEEWQKIREADIRKMGSKHHLETRVVRKDGQTMNIDLSVNILKDAGNKIIGSVGIMQDITEQKRMQQMLIQAKTTAEEASSAKSLFLANMSHEVRTPMNTIIGMIDLTLDTPLTDEQRENLKTVKDAADILLCLLNDILDLSRVEAGKIQLESIELNIPNIIKSVCKGLSVLAHNKNLELAWDIDEQIPDTLIGDPVRIRQVLVNLINNAIKFTFKGQILTAAKLVSRNENVYGILFSVKDQGIGIPKEKLGSIFEVFTQADVSTTRRFGGTGLGLSISKRLVEMMNGRIWVESEEYQGSTFAFTAKLFDGKKKEAAAVPEAVQPERAVAAQAGSSRILKILLAEDNIVNQKMTMKMLEKKGWEVKSAVNGKQVLEMIDAESYDAILMDAQMPVLDGFEATKLIRESEKKTGKHIPIIALTARAMSGDRKRCLASGMDGYVTKPIDRLQLYESIEKFAFRGVPDAS